MTGKSAGDRARIEPSPSRCVRRRRPHPVLTFALCLLTSALLASPAAAAPWWWAQFSKGDNATQSPNKFSVWHAELLSAASDTVNGGAGDTVYVHSFTWGSAGAEVPISGNSGANDIGINAVYSRRIGANPRKCYVIGDTGDASYPPPDINAGISLKGGNRGGDVHNKLYVVAGLGVITGSANCTDNGGMSSQPNNSVFIHRWALPNIVDQYVNHLYRESKGTFGDLSMAADDSSYSWLSPYGDSVEVYFSNDNNGSNGSIPGDLSVHGDGTSWGVMQGVCARLARGATKSIFYAINRPNLNIDNSFSGTFFDAILQSAALKAGVAQKSNQGVYPKNAYDSFSNQHTCRDADFYGATQMHHKFYIFDMQTVATGSMNTSRTSSEFSDGEENLIVIHDTGMARRYMTEWHRVMDRQSPNARSGGDAYDTKPNNPPTNLAVTPNVTDFTLTWTAPGDSGDFSRYYVFCSDSFIKTNKDVGDGIDNDGDGYLDNDPIRTINWDGFHTYTGTDPWLYPEVTLLAATPGAVTNCKVSTYGVHEPVAAATNYWFGIVAVDKWGNESLIDTAGPYMLGGAADTRLKVAKNSDIADTSVPVGETNVIALNVWIQGETGALQDTLTLFAVKNLGTSDSLDMTVLLWRDEDNDSKISAVDTMLAQLTYSTTARRFQATFAATDTRVRLGSAGKTFLVTLDIFDTATLGETFEAQVDAQTCSSPRRDSGPTSTVTNSGKITFVSKNPVDVTLRGNFASDNIAKGVSDTPAMTLRFSVVTPNDTMRVLGLTNDGTMTSADITRIAIYHDGNADSLVEASPTDTLIGYMRNVSGQVWSADTLSYFFSGDSIPLIIALSTASNATELRTFQGRIVANTADATVADTGPSADRVSSAVFTIPSNFGADTQIVINELQPNPGAASNIDGDAFTEEQDEEYVEVFNRGTQSVDMAGWSVVTKTSSENIIITSADSVILKPGYFGVFKSESTPQIASAVFRIFNETGINVESHPYSTNNWTTGAGVFNSTDDSAKLQNKAGTLIDSMGYSSQPNGDFPDYRRMDGLDETKSGSTTPSYGRPNGKFTVTATPLVSDQGVQFTITATAKDNENVTVTSFTGTANLSASKGTISPTVTGAFSAGVRSESVSITGLTVTDSIIVKVSYNTADTGLATVTINVIPPDTKTVVTKNSDIADTSAIRGFDTAVVMRLQIMGDTTGTGDTLSYFSVENLANADTADVMLELWQDVNADSKWTTGADSKVATLSKIDTATWTAANLSSVKAAYLGSGGTAGRSFLVIATVFDTAGLQDSLQLRVNALGVKATSFDSGPGTARTNNGILTIVSANQVTVVRRGDTPSGTIPKDDTRVAMTLSIGVTQANDTLTAFGITNAGTMGNADVAAIRLYQDAGSDSVLTSADTLIATIPFASGSTWRNTSISYPFTGTSLPVLVTVQTSVSATGNATFRGKISTYEVQTTKADSGPLAVESTSATFTVPSDTSPDTAIRINEIFSNTTGAGTGPDHDNDGIFGATDEQAVELYNNSNGSVIMSSWDLGDNTPGDVTFPVGLTLGPRQFLVIYRDTPTYTSGYWIRYATDGRTQLETGSMASGTFPAITAPDTPQLRNASASSVDSFFYATATSYRPWQRLYDGADTWAEKTISLGINQDPTSRFNKPSPNATFSCTTNLLSITAGDSVNLSIRMLDGDTTLIVVAGCTAALSVSTGTIIPAVTGIFSGGIRNDSFTITGIVANGSVTITAAFNQTTTGTTVITVYRRATCTAVIDLEARGNEAGCTGTFANGVDTYTGVSDSTGNIVFTSVKAGTYTLSVKEDHHLRRVVMGISISGTDTTLSSVLLRAGDVNGDNRVNVLDGSIIRFHKTAGTGVVADVDGNGAVNDADLGWVRTNFGRVGD